MPDSVRSQSYPLPTDRGLLSSYGEACLTPAPVNRMMAAFAADFRDDTDINLGVGYVNERTMPIDALRRAVDHVLSHPKEHRQPLNYGGPQGSPALRRAIHDYHAQRIDERVLDEREVFVGVSGATSVLEAMADVLKPGIVLTADPMYYIFCNYLERKGYTLATVPEDEHGIQPDALRAQIEALGSARQDIRFIYVVTVNNPTCSVLSNSRRLELVSIVGELSRDLGRHVPLVVDAAYEGLVHDPDVPPLESALPYDDAGVVYEVHTLSKIFAPALRVGYCIGPPNTIMKAMVQKTSDVGFSAPLLNQEIGARLMNTEMAEQQRRVNEGYQQKAQAVREAIDGNLGRHLDRYTGGRAGFYYYLTFANIETYEDSRFFKLLARTMGDEGLDGPPDNRHPRVIYIPGAFCVHPKGPLAVTGRRQLRLSYGFEETPRILDAITIMGEAADAAT